MNDANTGTTHDDARMPTLFKLLAELADRETERQDAYLDSLIDDLGNALKDGETAKIV